MLASATLVDFRQFRDTHHLIPQILDLGTRYSLEDYPQIEDSDNWEIYVKYRKIVSRFLIDKMSKGELEKHCVSLAKFLLSSLPL